MSGDNRIDLKINGVARPVRVRADHARTPTPAPVRAKVASDSVAVPQLISLAAEIASQPAPVDGARVAELRGAISDGSYSLDAGATSRAMFQFYGRGGDAG